MTDAYSIKEMLTEIRLDQREHNERAIRMEEGLAKQGEVLDKVLIQATKTNGRVTALEGVNNTRAGAHSLGKYLAIFAGGILLTYLGWLGTQVSDINKTLSAYEIEVQ